MFKAFMAIAVLLAVVAGGGYWNYQRNAHLVEEAEKPRPYRSLSDQDLAQLLSAYQANAQAARAGVANAPGEASQIDAYDSSDVGGKAQGFAAYQHQNDAWKRERGKAMEQEYMVKALREEKALRDRRVDDEWAQIWMRVTTF